MKKNKNQEKKYSAFIPAFVVFVFSFLLTLTFSDSSFSFVSAFIISFITYLIIKNQTDHILEDYKKQVLDLKKKSEEEHNSARLLVRRDLELRRANEKLKNIDTLKSNFISVVAHQLRTPLSGIKWTLSMLVSGDLGPLNKDQKDFLDKSIESNNRMIRLVNDMLNADRIDSGKEKYDFKLSEVLDLLDNIIYEMNVFATKKNIKLDFKERPSFVPKVNIDPEQIRMVIENLLDNAIKYTPPSGVVSVGVKTEKNLITIFIKDSGIGIPKESQPNVFSRFFRAQNAVRTVTDGSGLGLYVVKKVVERHGGKIWFESKEGEGTTFFVSLPISG